jgi:hypothetical protein
MRHLNFNNNPLNKGYKTLNYKAFNLQEGMVIYHENWDMKSEGPTISVPRHQLTERRDGKTFDVLTHFASKTWMTVGLLYEIARIIYDQARNEGQKCAMYPTLVELDNTVEHENDIFDRLDLYGMYDE